MVVAVPGRRHDVDAPVPRGQRAIEAFDRSVQWLGLSDDPAPRPWQPVPGADVAGGAVAEHDRGPGRGGGPGEIAHVLLVMMGCDDGLHRIRGQPAQMPGERGAHARRAGIDQQPVIEDGREALAEGERHEVGRPASEEEQRQAAPEELDTSSIRRREAGGVRDQRATLGRDDER